MSKIWVTRKDLRKFIKEAADINDDWGSMFDDEQKVDSAPKKQKQADQITQVIKRPAKLAKSPPSGVSSTPLKPAQASSALSASSSPTPSPDRPAAQPKIQKSQETGRSFANQKKEVQNTTIPQSTQNTPVDAKKNSRRVEMRPSGRFQYVGPLNDKSATQQYTKDELKAGADIDNMPEQPKAKRGILDRLKSLFSSDKKKSESPVKGFKQAPADMSPDKKRQYHKSQADQLQKTFDHYRERRQQAEKRHDVERSRHNEKMMRLAYNALRASDFTSPALRSG